MSENVLRIEHLTMQFGGVVAVDDFSMEVNRGEIVALIKPQFEVGKGNAPGGLVRDEGLRQGAVDKITAFAHDTLKLELLGLEKSPVPGREMGNIEFLSWWRKP